MMSSCGDPSRCCSRPSPWVSGICPPGSLTGPGIGYLCPEAAFEVPEALWEERASKAGTAQAQRTLIEDLGMWKRRNHFHRFDPSFLCLPTYFQVARRGGSEGQICPFVRVICFPSEEIPIFCCHSSQHERVSTGEATRREQFSARRST